MTPRGLDDNATNVIRDVTIAADHLPEPHTTLKNITRAITVMGKILEDLTDSISPAKPYVKAIAGIGLFGYGLVELSAPRSIWNLACRYWINLLTLSALLILVIGLFLKNPGTWQIGAAILLILAALAWCIETLRRFQDKQRFSLFIGFRQYVFLGLLAACGLLIVIFAGEIGHGFGQLADYRDVHIKQVESYIK